MRWSVAAAAILAAPLLVPTDALACSCVGGLAFSLPRFGAADAPLNPAIHLGYVFGDPPRDFTLVGADGLPVALDVVRVTSGGTQEVTLTAQGGQLLRPNTRYQLRGDGQVQLEFATGDRRDSQAPTFGGIASFSGGYDDGCTREGGAVMCDSCGPSTELFPLYAPSSDDGTAASDLLYRVYVETGGATPTTDSYSFVSPGWAVGQSFCNLTYAGLEVGDTVTIRATAIDAAGNESRLSAAATAVVEDDPDSQPSGCGETGTASSRPGTGSEAPVSGLTLFGLASLAALSLRRRR